MLLGSFRRFWSTQRPKNIPTRGCWSSFARAEVKEVETSEDLKLRGAIIRDKELIMLPNEQVRLAQMVW